MLDGKSTKAMLLGAMKAYLAGELGRDKCQEAIQEYCLKLQGGEWGQPSVEELQYAGRLHAVVESETAMDFLLAVEDVYQQGKESQA